MSTKPRIIHGPDDPTYAGYFASTHLPSGSTSDDQPFAVIDADSDPALVVDLEHGRLGDSGPTREPVVIHSSNRRKMALILSADCRLDEISARIEVLSLLRDEDAVPDYVKRFDVLVGPFEAGQLCIVFGVEPTLVRDVPTPPLTKGIREDTEVEGLDEPPSLEDEAEEDAELLEIDEIEVLEVLEVTEDDALVLPSRTHGDPKSQEILRDVRDLPGREPTPIRDDEVTAKHELADLEPPATSALETGDVAVGEGIVGCYGERIALHFAVEDERIGAFLEREPDCFLQLHKLPW
ncbi:MAG: hypothetical protein KC561_04355, partial [Myxococcales bacterium]|nr:hypothetical protein [Myxococcales bacterium]